MNINPQLTRRLAIALASTLLLAGCTPGAPDGSAPTGPAADGSWEVRLDAEAPFMRAEGDEASIAAPGDCWLQHEDGTVQVQVAGSSHPELSVESVKFADGWLTLSLSVPEEGTPVTLDYVLYQVMLTSKEAPEVKGVIVERGQESSELPQGVIAQLEEPSI